MEELSTLTTEMRNEKSTNIDTMSTKNILTLINDEDMSVAIENTGRFTRDRKDC